ncbi:hypothetical protein [Roseibium sp.]|uniref:hypothetical protein n=1 Tax=Roseibium sp. TaxID=1936156 RepID=UPI003BB21CA2
MIGAPATSCLLQSIENEGGKRGPADVPANDAPELRLERGACRVSTLKGEAIGDEKLLREMTANVFAGLVHWAVSGVENACVSMSQMDVASNAQAPESAALYSKNSLVFNRNITL